MTNTCVPQNDYCNPSGACALRVNKDRKLCEDIRCREVLEWEKKISKLEADLSKFDHHTMIPQAKDRLAHQPVLSAGQVEGVEISDLLLQKEQ